MKQTSPAGPSSHTTPPFLGSNTSRRRTKPLMESEMRWMINFRSFLGIISILMCLQIAVGQQQIHRQAGSDKNKIYGRPEDVGKAYTVKKHVACDVCRIIASEFWWKSAVAKNENQYYQILEERCHQNFNINPSLAADYYVEEVQSGSYELKPKYPGYEGPSMQLDFRTRGVELACAEILENLSEEFVDEIIRLRQEYAEKTAEMNIPQRRKEDQKFLYRLFENICVHTLQGTENCNWSQAMAEKIAVSPEISARRHKYARIPAQDSSRIEAEQEEDAATVAKRQRKAELLRKSKQTEAQTARVLVGPKHPKGSGTVDVKVRKIDL